MLDPEWALAVTGTALDNRHADDQYQGFAGGEQLVRLVLQVFTEHRSDAALRDQAVELFDRLMDRFAGYARSARGVGSRLKVLVSL
ncbi:MAG TPA: hypothetical protein VGP25_03620 [Gemmatimonadaceae bacterium]|nr:hypothetical protein [Gemmatimonadaceae bacterium]